MNTNYRTLVDHYEACLERHGDSHLGVDWPNAEDAERRYAVMLDVVREPGASLLDLGCGAGHLYEYLQREGRYVRYSGLDLSERFVSLCRDKHPDVLFHRVDLLTEPFGERYDYVVMNGVLTERRGMSHEQMWRFAAALLERAWGLAERGLAFNVMSKHVDWEREDLFHVGFDEMAELVQTRLSRQFSFRQDYGLYEYTVYVRR